VEGKRAVHPPGNPDLQAFRATIVYSLSAEADIGLPEAKGLQMQAFSKRL